MAGSMELFVRSFSETEPAVRNLLEKSGNGTARKDGTIYFRAGDQVYSCTDTPDGRSLLEGILSRGGTDPATRTGEQALRDALTGTGDAAALRNFGITGRTPRCVILFRSLHPEAELQREMIPVDEKDHIAVMENGDLALIMRTDRRSPEEVYEFAAAAAGTMESEAGVSCCAGIGRTTDTAESLADSYREARNALETGLKHKISGRVFVYCRQILERLADLIPEERAAAVRREILPPDAERALTPEILETIQAFFQNDLNLSTTARQLYIHRNTLLYRMEKIRKETGLDLRKFEDAVIFRMATILPEKQDS